MSLQECQDEGGVLKTLGPEARSFALFTRAELLKAHFLYSNPFKMGKNIVEV